MKTFPFTKMQIDQFRKEMQKAGGFYQLMYDKEAITIKRNAKWITSYTDIENYKLKYLIEVYETLRPFYDTEIPFLFWNALLEQITNIDPNKP